MVIGVILNSWCYRIATQDTHKDGGLRTATGTSRCTQLLCAALPTLFYVDWCSGKGLRPRVDRKNWPKGLGKAPSAKDCHAASSGMSTRRHMSDLMAHSSLRHSRSIRSREIPFRVIAAACWRKAAAVTAYFLRFHLGALIKEFQLS